MLENVCPVSNFSFLGKDVEKMVALPFQRTPEEADYSEPLGPASGLDMGLKQH